MDYHELYEITWKIDGIMKALSYKFYWRLIDDNTIECVCIHSKDNLIYESNTGCQLFAHNVRAILNGGRLVGPWACESSPIYSSAEGEILTRWRDIVSKISTVKYIIRKEY